MNIWSWTFAEKFCIIFKVCDRTDKGRGEVCQMLTNGDRKDGVKNHSKCAEIFVGWFFIKVCLKMKRSLELVSLPHFLHNF